MLTVRPLTLKEVREIYQTYMPEAFPPDEIRPFSSIRSLSQRGLYDCRGLFEDETLAGYAFFTRAEGGTALLLDYLAVLPGRRGQGLGSRFLSMLWESLRKKNDFCLIEAENPEKAETAAELAERERRVRFYTQNGCAVTDSECRLFGVEYAILVCPLRCSAPSEDEVFSSLTAIYRSMFPKTLYRAVCHPRRKNTPHAKETIL